MDGSLLFFDFLVILWILSLVLLADATAHNLSFKCRTRKVGQSNEKTAAAKGRAVPNALAAFVKRPQSGLQIGAGYILTGVLDVGNVGGQITPQF